MSRALRNLIELLDLKELEANIFRGASPKEGRQRLHVGCVPVVAVAREGLIRRIEA